MWVINTSDCKEPEDVCIFLIITIIVRDIVMILHVDCNGNGNINPANDLFNVNIVPEL